jgi:NADPH-dependent 2,4-dienoyl-CoA reductase/sulfur reductase-like enzyme
VSAGTSGERISFIFDGQPVSATAGQSLAAALTAAGILSLRETASGGARGVFCGMGVCQDCLVVVDGVPNQRACMVRVARSATVERQTIAAVPPIRDDLPPVALQDYPVETPQILIIGGGAGGLSSALAARRSGASVIVLDERSSAGGQYYKQPALPGLPVLDAQQAEGRSLVDAAVESGVVVVPQCEVWAAFPTDGAAAEIVALEPRGIRRFRPSRLIVATGAYELGLAVPGWTLPGVMTTGAAQTLWRSYGTLPGRRVLIAGNGPLNMQVAYELARAGATVTAVAEIASSPGVRSLGSLVFMTMADSSLVQAGVRYRTGLARYGVPILYRHVVTRIERADDGLLAMLAPLTGRRVARRARQFHADIVCLGYGFQPSNEILRSLGASHDYDVARAQLITQRLGDCATTVPCVYGVGDCCGVEGAQAAVAEGTLAGVAAARSLGFTTPEARRIEAEARRRLAHARRFERALRALFDVPRLTYELADRETTVCRCEEVSLGQLEAALADGSPSIGEVKQRTRAGMGRCQGRYCAPVIGALLAERQGGRLDEFSFFAPRAPVKPVAVASLARVARVP